MMGRICRAALVAAAFCAAMPAAGAGEAIFYDDYAQAAGGPEYAKDVAAAMALLKARQYDQALAEFQKADTVKLSEVPNYQLMPVIAWLQYRLGKSKDAEQTMAEADVALDILIGKRRCEQSGPNWTLATAGAPDAAAIGRAQQRMCSAFLADYLATSSKADAAFAGRLYVVKKLYGAAK